MFHVSCTENVTDHGTDGLQLPFVESSGYKARQHNLQRAKVPIMRRQLAMLIAEEVKLVMVRPFCAPLAYPPPILSVLTLSAQEALDEIGKPLTSSSGRRVTFEEIILVDIRRMSHGSLQPTLAVRGA